ncbi:Early growth response protein 1 [Larimichthys crocea]|uniref:Uncharacterized protein n=1 Tax=Larimichthys crocea TaxID=215358 RepID=A0ACD3R3F2_LARCR|nr:Early growth response protein 1 [Larimichthys crocea]
MAATKAELLLSALQISDPLSCFPPPLSPLEGYSKLEELQMLLQNAAAGGSLLAASAAEGAGLLSGDPGRVRRLFVGPPGPAESPPSHSSPHPSGLQRSLLLRAVELSLQWQQPVGGASAQLVHRFGQHGGSFPFILQPLFLFNVSHIIGDIIVISDPAKLHPDQLWLWRCCLGLLYDTNVYHCRLWLRPPPPAP